MVFVFWILPSRPSSRASFWAKPSAGIRHSSARMAITRDMCDSLLGQRVRTQLDVIDLRAVRGAALVVEDRARARHRPYALSLPAGARVIDPGIEQLGEEPGRIGHPHLDHLAVDH